MSWPKDKSFCFCEVRYEACISQTQGIRHKCLLVCLVNKIKHFQVVCFQLLLCVPFSVQWFNSSYSTVSSHCVPRRQEACSCQHMSSLLTSSQRSKDTYRRLEFLLFSCFSNCSPSLPLDKMELSDQVRDVNSTCIAILLVYFPD